MRVVKSQEIAEWQSSFSWEAYSGLIFHRIIHHALSFNGQLNRLMVEMCVVSSESIVID